jgi:hypothetical protein
MYKITIEKWPKDWTYEHDVNKVIRIQSQVTDEMVKDLNYMFEDDVLTLVFHQMLANLHKEQIIKQHGF